MKLILRPSLSAFLLMLLLLLGACGPAPRRVEPDNLFWPLPPAPPRIKYLESIYSEDDIGHVYSIKEMLLGKGYIDSLSRPYGVFARRGKIYVTDLIMGRVVVFDLVKKNMIPGGDEGAVQKPAAVVSDSAGTIYVADAAGFKIALYDPSGNYITAFLLGSVRPVALAIDELRSRLYVLDRNGNKVVVLSLKGEHLFEFGSKGSGDGQLHMPLGIVVDGHGKVYVLDSGNFRVQVFDADGRFLSRFGSPGDRPGFFSNPKGIAVDSDGHVYVTDAAFNNFQIFDGEGNILLFVGKLGSEPGQLYLPGGISIDENDHIYIADQLNRRVQVFQYVKSP